MAENQMAIKEWVTENVRKYKELLPDVRSASEKLTSEVYKDGALSCKTKRLMALAVALTHTGVRDVFCSRRSRLLHWGSVRRESSRRAVLPFVWALPWREEKLPGWFKC